MPFPPAVVRLRTRAGPHCIPCAGGEPAPERPEGKRARHRLRKVPALCWRLQFAAFRLKRFDPSSKLFLAIFQRGQFRLKGADAFQPEQGLLRLVGPPGRFRCLFNQGCEFRMQALFLRFLKEVDARQLRFQRFESVAFEHDPRVYAFGYIRIDFRARELFQNGGALIRRRLQERGEPSLRKEHGAREAFEVHPCGFLHFVGHALNIAFEDLTRNGVGKFAARGLQFPGGFFPRPPPAAPAGTSRASSLQTV
mgnify:CR=1 FL=1